MAKFLKGDDKILSKIKALIEKANKTDSLEEKESCMMMAQKLMQNNHIEHNRVTSYETVAEEGVEEDEIFYDEKYEAYLLHYIANSNFCRVILKGKEEIPDYGDGFEDSKCEAMIRPGDWKSKMCIIGEPTNVNMCLYLYSFFRNAILELVIKSYEGFLNEFDIVKLKVKIPKGHKEKFIANYCTGCVEGINDKLRQQKREAEMASSQLQGIMIIKANKVDEYMKKHYPFLGSDRSGTGGNSNSAAFKSGRADGAGLSSRSGVEQGNRGYIG